MNFGCTSRKDSQDLEQKTNKLVENYETDEAEGRALADDILNNGHKYPIDASPVLLPSWYSHELMINGQEYFHNNLFNMFVAKLSGLLALLAAPSIVRVLQKTDKSSKPLTAYKRYMSTIMHMMQWYETDLRNPNSKGRQSIMAVRGVHSAADRSAGPITQKDMALTQFGFAGLAIVGAKRLGLPSDQVGLMHFWRVIGHLMGVQDRFNVFRGSARCTAVACEELARRYFVPHLDHPPAEFEGMSQALLDGMWPVIVFYSPAAFMEHTRRLCGCKPTLSNLNFLAIFYLYLQIFVHNLMQIQFFAFFLVPFFNFQMWFTLFVQKTLPILAFLKFNRSLVQN